jgi:hypothetical protein
MGAGGNRNRAFEIAGWLLFVASALCFAVASIDDPWALAGSLFFLVACVVFLIPYARNR